MGNEPALEARDALIRVGVSTGTAGSVALAGLTELTGEKPEMLERLELCVDSLVVVLVTESEPPATLAV